MITAPPAIVMGDLASSTRTVIEECTNDLEAVSARTTRLTFFVELGGGYISTVTCSKSSDGSVRASISISQTKLAGKQAIRG